MRLTTLLLADAAIGAQGKLYIHGGGVSRINPPSYPWLQPQLAVVLRFQMEESDFGAWDPTPVTLTLLGPKEEEVIPPSSVELPPEAPAQQAEGTFIQLVVNFSPIVFMQPGTYELRILRGELVLDTVLLVAVESENSGS